MNRRDSYLAQILAGLVLLFTPSFSVIAQEVHNLDYRVTGSSPPPFLWLACIMEFGQKWRTEEGARVCLQKILDTGYFLAGTIEKEALPDSGWKLTVVLTAPSLTLTKFDLGVDEKNGRELREWLKQRRSLLQEGDPYSWDGERTQTLEILEWYRVRGQAVTVNTDLHLNYKDGTAMLLYRIVTGPQVPPEPSVVTSEEDCDRTVVAFNQTGIDDRVPLPLIDRMNRTRGASCFRPEWIEEDRTRLSATGLFSSVEYQVAGSGKDVTVNLLIKGKPLTVRNVEIRSYGPKPADACWSQAQLPLTAQSEYSRSKAAASRDILAKHCGGRGQNAKVLEHVDILSTSEIAVRFDILLYEENRVFVNGREVESKAIRDAENPPQR